MEAILDRREGDDRRDGREYGGKREVRDRRRARIPGSAGHRDRTRVASSGPVVFGAPGCAESEVEIRHSFAGSFVREVRLLEQGIVPASGSATMFSPARTCPSRSERASSASCRSARNTGSAWGCRRSCLSSRRSARPRRARAPRWSRRASARCRRLRRAARGRAHNARSRAWPMPLRVPGPSRAPGTSVVVGAGAALRSASASASPVSCIPSQPIARNATAKKVQVANRAKGSSMGTTRRRPSPSIEGRL